MVKSGLIQISCLALANFGLLVQQVKRPGWHGRESPLGIKGRSVSTPLTPDYRNGDHAAPAPIPPAVETQMLKDTALANVPAAFPTLIVEQSSDCVTFADADGFLIYINPAGRDLIGMLPHETIKDGHLADFVAPEFAQFCVEKVLPTARDKGGWRGETALLLRISGAAIPVVRTVTGLRDHNGQFIGYAAISPDITAQKASDGEEAPEIEVHYQWGDGSRAGMRIMGRAVKDAQGRMTSGVVAIVDIDDQRRAEDNLRRLTIGLEQRVEQRTHALRKANKLLAAEIGRREAPQAVRGVTAAMLKDLGHQVSIVPDAENALHWLRQDPTIRLVLSEIAMPGMDGRALAAEIQTIWPALPVLLFSGNADADEHGDAQVLGKPFSYEGLGRRIDDLLTGAGGPEGRGDPDA